MRAEVIQIRPDSTESAYDRALQLRQRAIENPSFENMAQAVDAWRHFEKLFVGRVMT